MNVERSVPVSHEQFQNIHAQNLHVVKRGEKILVRSVETYDASLDHAGGGVGFIITTLGGEEIKFVATSTAPVAGGSSFNLANALIDCDIKDVGIVSAIGEDPEGRHIMSTLDKRGLRKLTLFRREGTASSVVLREPDGTATIFACKPPYELPSDTLSKLVAACRAGTLFATGVLADDLPLVEPLWQAASPRLRVFSPHVSLVSESPNDRARCLELCKTADIVHLNDYEAAWLLQVRDTEGRIAFPSDEGAAEEVIRDNVTPLGTHIFCITRGERGSITYDGNRKQVVVQGIAQRVTGNSVGAGDIHCVALVYFLRLRGKTISLKGALEVASLVTAAKIAANDTRPWAGIPNSATRKPWVRKHY